jgi:hypothetical protein
LAPWYDHGTQLGPYNPAKSSKPTRPAWVQGNPPLPVGCRIAATQHRPHLETTLFDLRKLFAREARAGKGPVPDPDSDYHPSDRKGVGLEVEYQQLIAQQFRRSGISPNCITIEVRRIGQAPDGYDVLIGMVRLAHWERDSALRVLLGLPLLEHKVRKLVRGTWLADFSHFGGLWLHASEQLHAEGGLGELRDVMLELVPPAPRGPSTGPDTNPSGYSSSTVPPSSQMATGGSALGEQEPVSS